jgi:hypothetical protein
MLNGDVFVFDNVVHMYDLSDDNLKRPDSALDRQWHLKIGDMKRPKGQDKAYGITDAYKAFARRWTSEELGKMLFQESSTDMACRRRSCFTTFTRTALHQSVRNTISTKHFLIVRCSAAASIRLTRASLPHVTRWSAK